MDLVGLPDLGVREIQGVEVAVNGGKDGSNSDAEPAVDFTSLEGGHLDVNGIAIDFSDKFLQAAVQQITIDIADYVYISGGFSFTKGATLNATLSDGSLREVTTTTFGLSSVDVFVGDGPYFDSNDDGVIDGNDTPDPATTDAIGLLLENVDVAYISLKPTAGGPSYSALSLTADSFTPLGLPNELQLSAQTIQVEYNKGHGTPEVVVDFTELPGEKLTVSTGGDTFGFDYNSALLRLDTFIN